MGILAESSEVKTAELHGESDGKFSTEGNYNGGILCASRADESSLPHLPAWGRDLEIRRNKMSKSTGEFARERERCGALVKYLVSCPMVSIKPFLPRLGIRGEFYEASSFNIRSHRVERDD